MKKLILISIAVSSLFLSSCNNKTNDGDASNTGDNSDAKKVAIDSNKEKFNDAEIKPDTKFAVSAADGGMFEVELGKLALTKGNMPEIKKFGQMMIDDHGKANEELKNLAAGKNISLPLALGDSYQNKVKDLTAKTGNDFDKAYTSLMVSDHKEDIEHFKKEAEDGKDAEIKAWAAGKLSTLEHHLQMAESAEKMVKDKK